MASADNELQECMEFFIKLEMCRMPANTFPERMSQILQPILAIMTDEQRATVTAIYKDCLDEIQGPTSKQD